MLGIGKNAISSAMVGSTSPHMQVERMMNKAKREQMMQDVHAKIYEIDHSRENNIAKTGDKMFVKWDNLSRFLE